MAQAVFDIGGGFTFGEQVDSTGVAKAVNGIDGLESLRGQGHGEVFSAKTIDAKAGEFLTPLIDKEALLIEGLWGWSETRDVELEKLSGFGLQFYEAEAVAFAQDRQGFLLGVEVVQVKGGHFRGPGARIKKEVEEGVITEAFFSLQIHDMKEGEDLFRVEETDEGFLGALLGDGENGVSELSLLRIEEADHFGKGLEGSESLIASSGQVVALRLEIIQKGEEELRCDLLQPKGFDFDTVIICGKDQKELEGIPIGFEGMVAHSLDVREVVIEELVDGGG